MTLVRRPVVTLLSGPAAGVTGAAAAARDAGWESADLMTLDVGARALHLEIIVLCGFSGHGFKHAPLMGDIAADFILEG